MNEMLVPDFLRCHQDWQQDNVENPVFPHGASSKEKAILTILPLPLGWARSSGRGILAFSRKSGKEKKK
jgi:hypothetical protein